MKTDEKVNMTDLSSEYFNSPGGIKLYLLIQEKLKSGEISTKESEFVLKHAIEQYNVVFHKRMTPNKTEQLLTQELPDIFSLLDVVKYPGPVKKTVIVTSKDNFPEISQILLASNISFVQQHLNMNNYAISIIVFIKEYSAFNQLLTTNDLPNKISQSRIPINCFTYYLKGFPKSDFVMGAGGRISLEIDKGIKPYKTGIRKDIGIGFRSGWEANIARLLNYFNLKWEYEHGCLKIEDEFYHSFYIPDFTLEYGVIIEVKGNWDYDSRQKMRVLSTRLPSDKLLIIDGDLYFDICKKFKEIIPFWEGTYKYCLSYVVPIILNPDIIDKANMNNLKPGNNVYLEHRLDEFDKRNTIIVRTNFNQMIGFIPDDWTSVYSPKLKMGMEFSATVKSINENCLNIRILRANKNELILPEIFK